MKDRVRMIGLAAAAAIPHLRPMIEAQIAAERVELDCRIVPEYREALDVSRYISRMTIYGFDEVWASRGVLVALLERMPKEQAVDRIIARMQERYILGECPPIVSIVMDVERATRPSATNRPKDRSKDRS